MSLGDTDKIERSVGICLTPGIKNNLASPVCPGVQDMGRVQQGYRERDSRRRTGFFMVHLLARPQRYGRGPRRTVTQLIDREGGIHHNGRITPPTRVRFFLFALVQDLSWARTTTAIRAAHFFPPVMIILKKKHHSIDGGAYLKQ